jgi:dipeptidyl-peptidase-4
MPQLRHFLFLSIHIKAGNMTKLSKIFAIIFLFTLSVYGQGKKLITLEDIWSKNTLQVKGIEGFQWMKNGGQYSKLVQNEANTGFSICIFEVTTGKEIKTLIESKQLIFKGDSLPIQIDEYSFCKDESKLLIKTQSEGIYRYSSKAVFYVFEFKSGKLMKLSNGSKISYADISPNGQKVAYCKDNNLYYTDLTGSQVEIKVTNTGEKNRIINGSSDWVYEEEFELVKAFFWSPDSKKLAYYTFDETDVKEYNMQLWGSLYPEDYKFKYPKAGEKNSEISISVYELEKSSNKLLFDGKGLDIYIPRINWTSDANLLSFRWMNRFQDTLKIFHSNCTNGELKLIKTFTDPDYIELDDNFQYLAKSQEFICTSEEDGYRHIYRYDANGKLIKQITNGNWEVSAISAIDELKGLIFYTSREVSSIEQHLYSIDFEGNNKRKLTFNEGMNQPEINQSNTYFVNSNASKSGLLISLHNTKDGKLIKVLENNKEFENTLNEYLLGNLQYDEFLNSSLESLNYWIIKPASFDSTKKYPVLMFVYGGPGSQEVLRLWNRKNYLWFQILAEKGYMITCLDNRGTGGKGSKFKKSTTRQLGKLETEDQIQFAKYLGSLSYIDKNRIGIWGWSYGGYISTLCLLLGNDIFKLGIAVAPVTSWRFYDSIYTERYLKMPQDNTAGYDNYSPIKHADKLKGKYLLIHGTGDDNVHFQNAVEMQDALIKAGKQFDSFFYPNKSHGISGGGTRLHLYRMMTEYLDENL